MLKVGDFGVDFWIGIGYHKVAEDNRLGGDDLVVVEIKVGLHFVAQQLIEPRAILVVDETILKDATTLVVPQLKQLLHRLQKKKNKLK